MRQRRPIFLREWRKYRGLTLEQLAERLDMTHGQLSKLERGKRPYSQDFLERVAEELNREPADILVRNPAEPASIWSIWDRIKPPYRDTARRILEQLADDNSDEKTG